MPNYPLQLSTKNLGIDIKLYPLIEGAPQEAFVLNAHTLEDGQTFCIDLLNNLSDDVSFVKGSSITLTFKEGIVSSKTNYQDIQNDHPDFTIDFEYYTSYVVKSITLTYNSSSALVIKGVNEGQKQNHVIHLRNFLLDGDAITHSMATQVEVAYNLSCSSPCGNDQARHLTIDISDQRGRETLPIRLAFQDSNTVLNNGKVNDNIVFTLTNLGRHDINVPAGAIIQIYFDGEISPKDPQPWALAEVSQLEDITIGYGTDKVPATLDKSGPVPVWTIPASKPWPWLKNQALQITLVNIITNHPTGPANIYINTVGFTGYLDTGVVLQLQKSPMVKRGQNVGIGTTSPNLNYPLSFGGRKFEREAGELSRLLALYDGSPTDFYGLGFGGKSALLFHAGSGKHGGSKDYQNAHMVVNAAGQVGIGAPDPNFQLSLGTPNQPRQLALRDAPDEFSGFGATPEGVFIHAGTNNDDGAQMFVGNNGNVGIGTTDPNFRLSLGADDGTTRQLAVYEGTTGGVTEFWGIGAGNAALHLHSGTKDDKSAQLTIDNAGNVTIHGTLTVDGSITANSLTVKGPITADAITTKGLTVNGPITANGGLAVNGTYGITVEASDGLSVTGPITAKSGVHILGNLVVDGQYNSDMWLTGTFYYNNPPPGSGGSGNSSGWYPIASEGDRYVIYGDAVTGPSSVSSALRSPRTINQQNDEIRELKETILAQGAQMEALLRRLEALEQKG